jgi:dihydroorotate dehydrogenase (NAD+) catalytic subunit
MTSRRDVIEFMAAGARAVAFGTINYVDPMALPVALADLTVYLQENGIDDVNALVGLAHEDGGVRSPARELIVA